MQYLKRHVFKTNPFASLGRRIGAAAPLAFMLTLAVCPGAPLTAMGVSLNAMVVPQNAMDTEGYRIEVTVTGLSAEECYLAYHFGERQFLKDTVQSDPQGHFVFEGPDRLDPGMYMVVLPGQRYFEILVDHNQHFSVETRLDRMIESMEFSDSPDNKGFYDYLRFLNLQRPEMVRLREEINNPGTPADRQSELRERMDSINAGIRKQQNRYMEAFPDGLFSAILLAQRDPVIPDSLLQAGRNQEQVRQYFIENYWNNMDFSDNRLQKTPVYHNLLMRFFGEFLHQVPDTIIRYADRVIEKSRSNPDAFRYTVWFLTNFTERSQIMGMDAAYVHLVNRYYASGEAFWIEESALQRLLNRVDLIESLLVGEVAPDITMYTPGGAPLSLHGVDATYVVVYFWESDCVHCQRETPALKELYEQYRGNGLKVYAANIEGDAESWKRAIDRYGLEWINVNDPGNRSGFREKYDIYGIPLIFLLDSEKRIVAKKISVEQLEGFLDF
jgi:thiol-disulfide isomerase/thioredoxin